MAANGYQRSGQDCDVNENWSVVLTDTRYSTFEDPFSGMAVPKAEFDETYGPACREVFQCGITIEVLFAANPVMCGEWRFADEDARADLYDAAVEMGLVVSSAEVCAGETVVEKANRVAFEATLAASRAAAAMKPTGMGVRGGILCRGPVKSDHDTEVVFADDTSTKKAQARPKTGAELQEELGRVLAEFELSGLSNKRRKKLERRQRGIMAALEKSDEGVA
jgi:hypothetical protein